MEALRLFRRNHEKPVSSDSTIFTRIHFKQTLQFVCLKWLQDVGHTTIGSLCKIMFHLGSERQSVLYIWLNSYYQVELQTNQDSHHIWNLKLSGAVSSVLLTRQTITLQPLQCFCPEPGLFFPWFCILQWSEPSKRETCSTTKMPVQRK